MADPLYIVLVSDVDVGTIPIDWHLPCMMCGSTEQYANLNVDGHIWEGDECVCAECGLIDTWGVSNGLAYLTHFQDESLNFRVSKEHFNHKIWMNEARDQGQVLEVHHEE
ncbi:MAG: hypothetical protein AAFV53_31435 [Myxococcota bacterium]